MSISGKMSLCTRTKTFWKCRQITTTTTTQPSQTTRKSPARLAFRQEKQQTRQTKGPEPKQKQPPKRFAKGHSGLTTASFKKHAKMNYDPRHSNSKILSVHSYRAPYSKISCRTVQVLPELFSSSQYHTCSALHHRSQGVQQEIQHKLPLTHRVGHLDATDSEKEYSIHVRNIV